MRGHGQHKKRSSLSVAALLSALTGCQLRAHADEPWISSYPREPRPSDQAWTAAHRTIQPPPPPPTVGYQAVRLSKRFLRTPPSLRFHLSAFPQSPHRRFESLLAAMDFPKRALPQGSPRRSPRAMRPGAVTEADENVSPKLLVPAGVASPQRKRVLGERKGGVGMEAASTPSPPPQLKPAPSPPSLTGRGAGAYDPKTNYTTPRPEFLRYDPERRREILHRLARAAADDDDRSSATSGAAASEATVSVVLSARGSDSEAELDDGDDEEEEVLSARRGGSSRRLLLLFVAMACSFCYICCPEDVLEETTSQIVHGDSEDVVSPRNLMAVAMMVLADICPSVPLGEFTCRIGDKISENVYLKEDKISENVYLKEDKISENVYLKEDKISENVYLKEDKISENVYLKEDSELAEQKAVVLTGSFENADQSSKVGCFGGNISWDSIGSISTHTADKEEGSSGLVHEEKGEDYSNPCVPQLISMEKAMESASYKLEDTKGLESEGLDLDTELWQYENTAEAAKAICCAVKFLWSAMEPHLLQILASLSVAAFVAAMFKYFQRAPEITAPASQHMLSKSLAEVPVLVPHQDAQLPVSPSPQSVLLPVYSSQQPVQLTVSKQDLSARLEIPMQFQVPKSDSFVNLKVPVQLSLPKTEPFVNLEFPVTDHGNSDRKLQQGNAENMKASHGNSLDNIDSSKPPVVELLGEFTFADRSRGRSINILNQHTGDAAVQDPLESLGKDVDKMQKNLSIVQSLTVQRARKEENAVKGEKMDATPTPLRRSNRLRNKVTSP